MKTAHTNFDEFLRGQADRFGARPCLTQGETGVSYSYAELNDLADRAAAYLAGIGLKKGDRFGMLTRNSPEFFFCTARL